jgi:hypothetical protein
MIKVKRNRLKIFESLAPNHDEPTLFDEKAQKKLTKELSKFNLNSCILDERLIENGSNSLSITLPYQISEEIVYSICSYYGEISYIKTSLFEGEGRKYTK